MSQFKPGDRVQVVPSPCVEDPALEGLTGTVIEPSPEITALLLIVRSIAGPKPGHEDVTVQIDESRALMICSTALRMAPREPNWSEIRAQLGYTPPVTP